MGREAFTPSSKRGLGLLAAAALAVAGAVAWGYSPRVRCAFGDDGDCWQCASDAIADGDYATAKSLLEPLCANTHFGCDDLGRLHFNGWGVPRNRKRAVELFQKSCDNAPDEGGDMTGVRCPPRAHAEALMRCEAGDTMGCTERESLVKSHPSYDPLR